jgi:hypothetical protein
VEEHGPAAHLRVGPDLDRLEVALRRVAALPDLI